MTNVQMTQDQASLPESKPSEVPAVTTRERLLDDQRNVTGRISDNCRFIAFGLLAVYYTIMASAEPFAQAVKSHDWIALQAMATTAALAVLSDYLQYFFAYRAVREALKQPANRAGYNQESCAYKMRQGFFGAKQLTTAVGALALTFIVVRTALR